MKSPEARNMDIIQENANRWNKAIDTTTKASGMSPQEAADQLRENIVDYQNGHPIEELSRLSRDEAEAIVTEEVVPIAMTEEAWKSAAKVREENEKEKAKEAEENQKQREQW